MAEQAPGTREKRGSTTKILQGLGHPCYGARLGEQVFRAIAWFTGDGYTLMSFNEVLHRGGAYSAYWAETQTGHHQTSETKGAPSLHHPLHGAGDRGQCLCFPLQSSPLLALVGYKIPGFPHSVVFLSPTEVSCCLCPVSAWC